MKLIAIEEFCSHHGVEVTLIREFADFGLVRLQVEGGGEFLPDADISRLERMVRLFRELGVNKEGIEIILNMREEIKALRREKAALAYRLQQLEAERLHQLVTQPRLRGYLFDYSDPE